MSRIIKFRAWDGFRMYSPAIVDGKEWNMMEDREILGYPLMQYTGLKDRKGEEIYEGDVVDLFWPFAGATYRCKVFWLTERGCWAMAQDQGKATYNGIFHYFGSQDTKLMDIEVVGNIYQTIE